MNKETEITPYEAAANSKDIVIYKTQDSEISINVLVENESVWLTQKQMGLLSSAEISGKFLAKFTSLNGLVCNAVSGGSEPTADGFDMTFGTGHLGHFLLTNLLLKNMADNARIIFVSSDQHNPPRFIAKINYTDALDFAFPKKQNHNVKYSFTKLCNIYCAYYLSKKIQQETDKNICVNAFNPAFMADTGLAKPKNAAEKMLYKLAPLFARFMGRLFLTGFRNITQKRFDPQYNSKYFIDFFQSIYNGNYKCVPLKNISRINSGAIINTADYLLDGIPLIRIQNIQTNGITFDDVKYISQENFEKNSPSEIIENELLFGMSGTIGRVAIVQKSIPQCLLNQRIAKIKIDNNFANEIFIQSVLNSEIGIQQFKRIGTGGIQININTNDISNLCESGVELCSLTSFFYLIFLQNNLSNRQISFSSTLLPYFFLLF